MRGYRRARKVERLGLYAAVIGGWTMGVGAIRGDLELAGTAFLAAIVAGVVALTARIVGDFQ